MRAVCSLKKKKVVDQEWTSHVDVDFPLIKVRWNRAAQHRLIAVRFVRALPVCAERAVWTPTSS